MDVKECLRFVFRNIFALRLFTAQVLHHLYNFKGLYLKNLNLFVQMIVLGQDFSALSHCLMIYLKSEFISTELNKFTVSTHVCKTSLKAFR